jgi:hypothetical protein
LAGELDGHFGAGLGFAPDRDGDLALQHSVIGERTREPQFLGGRQRWNQQAEQNQRAAERREARETKA